MINRVAMTRLSRMQEQSTWRLLGLGIITYGVYFAYYIDRQSQRINQLTDDRQLHISYGMVKTIYLFSYLSLVGFIATLLPEPGQTVDLVSALLDLSASLLLLGWGFAARSRMNRLLGLTKGSRQWFRVLWTLLFSPLYFNYKINVICQEPR